MPGVYKFEKESDLHQSIHPEGFYEVGFYLTPECNPSAFHSQHMHDMNILCVMQKRTGLFAGHTEVCKVEASSLHHGDWHCRQGRQAAR